jgi:hypothetical protein
VQNQNKNLEKCQKKTFSFFLKRSCVDVAKEMFEEDIAEGMLIKYMTVDVGLPNHNGDTLLLFFQNYKTVLRMFCFTGNICHRLSLML